MIPSRILSLEFRRNFASASAYTIRTHTCDELSIKNKDEKVTVMGWLSYKRMNKFIVLRDSYGSVQATLPADPKFKNILKDLPYESVVKVEGIVKDRGENRNKDMKTGDIEIGVENLVVLNRAQNVIPMLPDENVSEKLRLQYRYIDLRSEKMQRALRIRSEFVHNLRKFLVERRKFVDVETPTLFRRTPGGAAEFVVPAPPPFNGMAYSLPQSPQQFKQLLMVGGIDRYFQIARCYRDEGSKGDRQPEFTQVDIEMSFTTQEGVLKLIEDMIISAWPKTLEHLKPMTPFPRITYEDAMNLYGIDKPDMRVPWKIEDSGDVFNFLKPAQEFSETWTAKVIVCHGAGKTQITNSIKNEWKRLIQMNKFGTNFAICHPSQSNWFKNIKNGEIQRKFGLSEEDALIVCWGASGSVTWTLGQLRNYVADACGLRSRNEVTAHWVVDFPLFSFENEKIVSTHHPFTAAREEDEQELYSNDDGRLLKITGQHYDLVINGVEMGGGSIRIHDSEKQKHVLNLLKEPTDQLTHLLESLSSGAPPHGGFALGLDRFIALLTSEGNPNTPVRDVIAFPKTKNGNDLMCDSPVPLSEEQKQRYKIVLNS